MLISYNVHKRKLCQSYPIKLFVIAKVWTPTHCTLALKTHNIVSKNPRKILRKPLVYIFYVSMWQNRYMPIVLRGQYEFTLFVAFLTMPTRVNTTTSPRWNSPLTHYWFFGAGIIIISFYHTLHFFLREFSEFLYLESVSNSESEGYGYVLYIFITLRYWTSSKWI